jgi:hypothetical protein
VTRALPIAVAFLLKRLQMKAQMIVVRRKE